MADRGEQRFTEAEKRQIEIWNRQFMQKKYLAQIRRRNMMVFGGLLTSVAAIYGYTLLATKQEHLDFEE
ncbi:unnamed protein product [Pocillopora meandrina]|uniref:Cytochrome c oxidase assembly factor 3 mitochondrial coiled-coil domain-containing protein n=1 Tax=Pocillopora meandrina TaxID=46732 RepID=A0AAU9X0B2_9CNID|nr:unnamed protein product [Pocillopora meandrina]